VAQRGNLFDQLERLTEPVAAPKASSEVRCGHDARADPAVPDLEFFNGLGGFADNGKQYVTVLGPGQSTPAPWINVISNPVSAFRSLRRRRIYMGGQQPGKPADTLVE
jgi:cyclic beta-1,2-glucan synthetase